MHTQNIQGRIISKGRCLALILISIAINGCNRTTPEPLVPPLDAGPAARAPHKTLMLHIEFANVGAAQASPAPLKKAMQGVATVENGPFVLGGQPFVRFAVSIPPDAPADPVLQKVRAISGVKNVAIR